MIKNTDTSQSSQSERLLSAFSHASILIPRIGFLIPIIIWILQANQKNKSQFLTFQSFQALTYQVIIIIIGFIGGIFSTLSVFIANTYLIFPMMIVGSITKFIFIAYGIFGAVITFQGKPFSYWIIGSQVERFIPTIILKPSKIYIALIVFVLLYVLIIAAYFLIAMIGQSNA